jgi:hypothetical protein
LDKKIIWIADCLDCKLEFAEIKGGEVMFTFWWLEELEKIKLYL